jgi:hypothetical protein
MSKTNVIVLNTAEQTSTLAFDNVNSLVNFVGHFLDAHNKWNLDCELILVHQNNQVVRMRFRTLGGLVDFTRGIRVTAWLSTDSSSTPNLNSLEWSDEDGVSKVFDSSDAEPNEYGELPE